MRTVDNRPRSEVVWIQEAGDAGSCNRARQVEERPAFTRTWRVHAGGIELRVTMEPNGGLRMKAAAGRSAVPVIVRLCPLGPRRPGPGVRWSSPRHGPHGGRMPGILELEHRAFEALLALAADPTAWAMSTCAVELWPAWRALRRGLILPVLPNAGGFLPACVAARAGRAVALASFLARHPHGAQLVAEAVSGEAPADGLQDRVDHLEAAVSGLRDLPSRVRTEADARCLCEGLQELEGELQAVAAELTRGGELDGVGRLELRARVASWRSSVAEWRPRAARALELAVDGWVDGTRVGELLEASARAAADDEVARNERVVGWSIEEVRDQTGHLARVAHEAPAASAVRRAYTALAEALECWCRARRALIASYQRAGIPEERWAVSRPQAQHRRALDLDPRPVLTMMAGVVRSMRPDGRALQSAPA